MLAFLVADDTAWVDRLISQLGADLSGYTTTRPFPRQLNADEGSAIAGRLQSEVDKGVASLNAGIAKAKQKLACTRGCAGCCEEPVMVFRPEAARIAAFLAEHADARAHFLAQYPAWHAAIGDAVEALATTFETDDIPAYTAAHVDAWKRGVMCAFNKGGECTIYAVRPIACRTAHALDTSEHCTGAATEPAKRATFVPLDTFVARTRKLLAATHNAMHAQRGRPASVCIAVRSLLD